jgi:outer membrane immunogenic protein
MRKILLAGVAALFVVPAVAADLPTKKAPAPIPVVTEYDWTGIYFGGNLGGIWGNSNSSYYNLSNGVLATSNSANVNSFIGGGQIGYRYMFPQRFVIGAEANLDWNNGSGAHSNAWLLNNKYVQSTTYSSGLGGYVVGQAGYAWGDFLPYVKGGWAWTNSTVTYWQNYGTVGTLAAGTAQQAGLYRSGWTVGAGLSYHVWQNWEVFGQYMYANYGTATVNFISPLSQSVRTSLNTNTLTAGVNLKF